jgi:hypothetical protein
MNDCPECKVLDEAYTAAFERVKAAGRHPPMATPAQLIEVTESKKDFDEIKAKRTAHFEQHARSD